MFVGSEVGMWVGLKRRVSIVSSSHRGACGIYEQIVISFKWSYCCF